MYLLPSLAVSWLISLSVAGAFVIGIIIASFLWKRDIQIGSETVETPEGGFPFDKTRALMTQYEHDLFRMLDRELRKDFYVFVKVRLGAAVTMRKRVQRAQFYERLIGNRHVDFLLCDRDSLRPLLAIQVVEPKGADHHEITEEILDSARLPCLKLSPRKVLAPSELTFKVAEAIKQRKRNDADVES